MSRRVSFPLVILAVLVVACPPIAAQDIPGELDFGGWIWADYGNGDRYPDEQGGDRLGFSEAALLTKYKYENFEAVLLLGAQLFAGDEQLDGNIFVADAFVVWHEIGGSKFFISAGAQPLFFGLKPNGFPGDRSLQPSLEYGGAGGFAVSQQAGPSIRFGYDLGELGELTGGLFDTSSSTAAYFEQTGLGNIDGSSLDKNYFLQLKLDRLGVDGLYGVVGFEQRYVGGAVDSSEPIFDVGIGYGNDRFDLSLELISLDQTLTNTLDDDTYTIVELSLYPNKRVSLFADWGEADEAELETLRFGVRVQIKKPAALHFEYSTDDGPQGGDIDSVDVRLSLDF